MQIHELTRPQLNEVDLAGPGGLINTAKSAASMGSLFKSQKSAGANLWQKAKAALASNPLTSTSALGQSGFAQKMTDVRTQAAVKQMATYLQQQWKQYSSQTQSTATATAPASNSSQTQSTVATPESITRSNQNNLRKAGQQLNEAATIGDLEKFYTKFVIPQSMVSQADEYLNDPTIKTALNAVISSANNDNQQNQAFQDLVTATSKKSLGLAAQNPGRGRSTVSGGGASLSTSASVAQQEISQQAGISPAQIKAIAKITSQLGRVQAADASTLAHLEALGFNIK